MKQEDQVLSHLKKGSITPIQALNYGCFRLAAVVKRLRDKGHNIHTQMMHEKGKHYAKYYLTRGKKK